MTNQGQIGGPRPDRFELRLGPDGVYRVNGRVIPIADDAAKGVDDCQLVPEIHLRADQRVSRSGVCLGVNVEQR